MKVVREIATLDLDRSKTVGLVPTMGAFHDGHLELMRQARAQGDVLVVSLFVNPTQFGAGEDFERYPRNEERDFSLAEEVGVDVIFAPSVEEMYPEIATRIHVEGVSELWEGAFRPGHFDGVATVVAKLFNIVRPDFAVFGEKDYQQCRVIERIVEDLNVPVRLVFAPTVREADGLAMSSRNAYLGPELRQLAPQLHRELIKLAASLRQSKTEFEAQSLIDESVQSLTRVGFAIDYLELVDSKYLLQTREISSAARLIVAARLGKTRLIDNIALM